MYTAEKFHSPYRAPEPRAALWTRLRVAVGRWIKGSSKVDAPVPARRVVARVTAISSQSVTDSRRPGLHHRWKPSDRVATL